LRRNVVESMLKPQLLSRVERDARAYALRL